MKIQYKSLAAWNFSCWSLLRQYLFDVLGNGVLKSSYQLHIPPHMHTNTRKMVFQSRREKIISRITLLTYELNLIEKENTPEKNSLRSIFFPLFGMAIFALEITTI